MRQRNACTRLLIIGSGSFLARHYLQESEFARRARVFTVGRGEATYSDHFKMDAGDLNALIQVIEQAEPTHILNFIGLTKGPLEQMIRYNVGVSSVVFDAVETLSVSPKLVVLGTAAEYGFPQAEPMVEDHPLNPIADYGLTKKWQTELAILKRGRGVDVTVARVFNLLGTGLGSHLVFGSLVEQIASMPTEGGTLKVGNLETSRDFLHVSDAVEALDLLLSGPTEKAVYHLASGRSERIRGLLDHLIEQSGKDVAVEIDPDRLRGNDVQSISGNVDRLSIEFGWQPKLNAKTALEEMIAAI